MSKQVVKKLSATKQKLSLGEVKKTEKANAAANTRKVVRTTVVNPHDLEWPVVSVEDEKELLDILTTDLQTLRFPNYHIPLSVISKIEKGDRRKHRHILHTQRAIEVGFDVANYTRLRGDLSIGANCVSTAMEQDVLKAVIIDKDVDPPIITKLLVPIARSKEVPIVAICGLSKTCQSVFKTRCIAMGFKANCCEVSHPFYRIYRKISTISEKEFQVIEDAATALVLSYSNNDAAQASVSVSSSSKDDEGTGGTGRKRGRSSRSESFIPPKIRKV